jgi:methionine-rich copper-binding protein CopC
MNPSTQMHPSEETIERYVRGKLSNDELDSFEEHLLACVRCQSCAEALDMFVRTIKEAAHELEHQPPRRDSFWSMPISSPRVAWTLAFVAAAMFVILIPSRNPGSQDISLAATRGGESAVHGKAKVPITLQLDLTGLAPLSDQYVVEVVDSSGNLVGTYKAPASGDKLTVKIPDRLRAGQYWVRLHTLAKSDLLREFGLAMD